jgi:hypothetical protein
VSDTGVEGTELIGFASFDIEVELGQKSAVARGHLCAPILIIWQEAARSFTPRAAILNVPLDRGLTEREGSRRKQNNRLLAGVPTAVSIPRSETFRHRIAMCAFDLQAFVRMVAAC